MTTSSTFSTAPKALPNATNFERNAETFILAERLKEERLKAGLYGKPSPPGHEYTEL